jgi:hypothetical protein
VTSQPPPAPGDARSASQYLRPLRDIAAYALVAATAVMLFVAIIRLIPSGVGQDFGTRAQDSFYSYVNVPTIFFPLGAVLLSLLVKPQHPNAKLVTVIAAVEYAVAAVFAVIFGILIGLIKIAGFSVRTAFEELLIRAAWLAVFAVAAFATYQVWRHLFYTPKPKPKPQPGVYGQPQYGVPGTHPGQPGYGQPGFGQPGFAQPGQPGFGQPGQPGQPGQAGFGQPGQPGFGHAQPPFGQPGQPGYPGQPGPGQPVPGQPVPGQPPWGQPAYGAPAGYPGAPQGASSVPPAWGQPVSGQPAATQPVPGEGAWGQSVSSQPAATQPVPGATAWDQPAATQPVPSEPAVAQPVSAQPVSAQPASGASDTPPGPFAPEPGHVPGPYSSPAAATYGSGSSEPQGYTAFTEPTQAVPQHDPEGQSDGTDSESADSDRTQIVGHDRPGYGPADQDPPRR